MPSPCLIFSKRPTSRHCGAPLISILYCALLLAGGSTHAADNWTDISSSLLERLTNNGARAPWPGACSGVVVHRTNADVAIKVVGLGLCPRSDQSRDWCRIELERKSG